MIILTDSNKNCPEFEERIIVDNKNINQYVGNHEVKAIFCSRATAKQILNLNFPELKFIQLFSAGYDGINLDIIKKRGITLCNAANVYNIEMAEFVVYAMLMRAKRYHHSIKNHFLRPFRNYHYITELYGKTVGIMGCGNIGKQIAKRLSAFDMKVIGFDTKVESNSFFEIIYGELEKHIFISQCDYLVNCIPLTPKTEKMFDHSWFNLMKKDITIINVARKELINNTDFYIFLKENHDVTAILDMFELIPNPITNPYRRLSNVLILPGVTAISNESLLRLHNLLRNNRDNFINNKPLLNVII